MKFLLGISQTYFCSIFVSTHSFDAFQRAVWKRKVLPRFLGRCWNGQYGDAHAEDQLGWPGSYSGRSWVHREVSGKLRAESDKLVCPDTQRAQDRRRLRPDMRLYAGGRWENHSKRVHHWRGREGQEFSYFQVQNYSIKYTCYSCTNWLPKTKSLYQLKKEYKEIKNTIKLLVKILKIYEIKILHNKWFSRINF